MGELSKEEQQAWLLGFMAAAALYGGHPQYEELRDWYLAGRGKLRDVETQ